MNKKTYFSKLSKKRDFLRNVDIYGDMNKKRVLQNDLKKPCFSRNVDIFRHIDTKHNFFREI